MGQSVDNSNTVLVVGPTPPPHTGTEVMTEVLLGGRIARCFRLIHMNTSRRRPVDTKGRFDVVNITWGLTHVMLLLWLLVRHRPVAVVLSFAQNRAASLRDGLFVLISAASGVKVVALFHNATFHAFYEKCDVLWQAFLRIALRRIDRVIVLAEALAGQFGGLVEAERVRVCYNGIDAAAFSKAWESAHQRRSANRVQFLFVGHLSRAKGAVDLLCAFRQAAETEPSIQTVLIGAPITVERNVTVPVHGQEDWDLEFRRTAAMLPGRVSAPGVVTGDSKMSLFMRSDVFVLPSYSEAFPVSILEAMASGLPIITTAVGALPEVLVSDVNAIFVEPGDRAALVQAMLRLAGDASLRSDMGQANKRLVRKRFTREHFESRFAEILDELVDTRRAVG